MKCFVCGKDVEFKRRSERIDECPECGQQFEDGYPLQEAKYTREEIEAIQRHYRKEKQKEQEQGVAGRA